MTTHPSPGATRHLSLVPCLRAQRSGVQRHASQWLASVPLHPAKRGEGKQSLRRLHLQRHAFAADHAHRRACRQVGAGDVPVRIADLHAAVAATIARSQRQRRGRPAPRCAGSAPAGRSCGRDRGTSLPVDADGDERRAARTAPPAPAAACPGTPAPAGTPPPAAKPSHSMNAPGASASAAISSQRDRRPQRRHSQRMRSASRARRRRRLRRACRLAFERFAGQFGDAAERADHAGRLPSASSRTSGSATRPAP